MRLKDNVIIMFREEQKETVINKGTTEFIIEDVNKHYFNILSKRYFDNRISDEIKCFLLENNLVCDNEDYSTIDASLEKNLYYIESIADSPDTSSIEIQREIQNKKIGIVGIGGTGTVVLEHLQRIGFQNFYVIDFDFVEASNLNRQVLFRDIDLGQRKTEAILNNVLKKTKIKTVNRQVREPNDLSNIGFENMDIIVNCADKPRNIEHIVASFCNRYNIPFVSASVGIETGTWGPIYDKSNKFPYDNLDLFTHSIKGSISPTNSIIGSFLAYDVFIYLTNLKDKYPIYNKKIIDFLKLRIEVLR